MPLRSLSQKKGLVTAEKRECVSILVDAGLSIVKACLFVGIARATFYRRKRDWRKADSAVIDAINAVLDFMHDTFYCGKRFRTLNAVDEGTRECLAIEVNTSLPVAMSYAF